MKDYLQQVSPNNWSCLPTAFAKLFNIPVGGIFNYLAHDGSERVFNKPNLITAGYESSENIALTERYADSLTRRAFHLQEIIDYAFFVHYTLVAQIDVNPISTNGKDLYELETIAHCRLQERLFSYMQHNDGVIICENKITAHQHAVTWFKGLIYDPSGKNYTFDEFTKIFKIHAFLLTYQMSPPCG